MIKKTPQKPVIGLALTGAALMTGLHLWPPLSALIAEPTNLALPIHMSALITAAAWASVGIQVKIKREQSAPENAPISVSRSDVIKSLFQLLLGIVMISATAISFDVLGEEAWVQAAGSLLIALIFPLAYKLGLMVKVLETTKAAGDGNDDEDNPEHESKGTE